MFHFSYRLFRFHTNKKLRIILTITTTIMGLCIIKIDLICNRGPLDNTVFNEMITITPVVIRQPERSDITSIIASTQINLIHWVTQRLMCFQCWFSEKCVEVIAFALSMRRKCVYFKRLAFVLSNVISKNCLFVLDWTDMFPQTIIWKLCNGRDCQRVC